MLKNMKKSTKSNVITLGIVVGFYVLIQILSAAGALTNSFSGQLVPQDPADEPASALLARLREEAPTARIRRRRTA